MAFPTSPTNGQITIVGGVAYQYATTTNSWGRIVSTANVITANVITVDTLTANTLSATGNVTGNYILGNGSLLTGVASGSSSNIVSGTSNITIVSSGGNATVNIGGTGNVAVFATTGEYVTGVVSATGNVTGGNILTGGLISATGTLSVTGVTTLAAVGTGNLAAGNITTGGLISAGGNITGGNVLTSGLISSTGTITGSSILGSVISVTGNVTSNYFVGNGSLLTGISSTPTSIVNGTSNVVAASSGNVTVGVAETPNVAVFATTGEYVTGVISATGNITGGNVISGGTRVYKWTTQANTAPAGNVPGDQWYDSYSSKLYQYINDGTGNQWVDQSFPTSFANLSVTGNIQGGNVTTSGLVSATGNVAGNYFIGNGSALTGIATGSSSNITSGTSNVTIVSSGGNATVSIGGTSNVAVFATTGEYVTGLISATGNITANNGMFTNIVNTASHTGAVVSVTGNVTANNGMFTNIVNVASHTGAVVSVSGNITGGNIVSAGVISATGNAAGGGVQIVTITDSSTVAGYGKAFALQSGTNNLALVGNITNGSYNGFQSTGDIAMLVSGSTVGNVGFSIIPWSGLNAGIRIAAVSNISTITLTANTIAIGGPVTNIQGNGVGNIGNATGYFNRLFAQATTALYADLAEVYKADAKYPPGTVLVFGGDQEVTVSTQSHDVRIAGVVSTNPAHVMNSGLISEYTVDVGLIGRVPCQVIGPIAAGDRVVSSNRAGVAERLDMQHYQPGVIIGKAVESYNGTGVGTIEIVVGRL